MTADRPDKETYTVVFQPSGARGRIEAGTNLRAAARQLGVEIESVCAENATCGKCRVYIETGEVERMGITSSLEHVSDIGSAEEAYLEPRLESWRKTGVSVEKLRLSCQAELCGDVLVFVPEFSRGNRQIVRKSATERAIEIRPTVRRYYVELESPTLANPLGDWERLTRALVPVMDKVNAANPDWKSIAPADLTADFKLIPNLPNVLREADWKVTVAIWNDARVLDITPGYTDQMYGAAVDIGTTTIALYLCDLASGEVVASESMMNPQVAYGDDIMSRISYAIENEHGLDALHKAVIDAVNTLLKRARRAKRLKEADILELVVVGNTCMHHLFLKLPVKSLGLAPYVPVLKRPLDLPARELGLAMHLAGNVHLLPIQASFVGADNMAVMIAEEPYNQDEQWMIIDVGTNAEIELGNRERLLCTSTPTGPAFEGAHIEYGMRAAPGAIERVEIDDDTLEPSYKVIGQDGWNTEQAGELEPVKGICGSAIIDAVAELYRTGIVDTRGRFVEPVKSERIRKGEFSWEYVIAWEDETSIGRDIPITVRDIQQIQLAKAALYVATKLLLKEMGIERPDKIILAGGFGSYIDKTKAMILGMIPDCSLENVYAVGNAAGDGARIALLNRQKRQEAVEVARRIERIELPVDPSFQSRYMLALNLPHMTDEFPSISHLIPHYEPDPTAAKLFEAEL